LRVLLLGSAGLLGRALRTQPTHGAQGTQLISFTRQELDIRDVAAVEAKVREHRPDWVLNATAYTNVDGAETDPESAYAVNATAVGALAECCRASGCGVVHFSTDFVFAGDTERCYDEGDEPRPVNAYGASKLAGEELVRLSGARHLIVRTQWVFGVGGTSFLSTLWHRAMERQPTRVVADEYGCCTYAADLADVTWRSLGRLEGTYHVANRGRVSRYEIAQRVFAATGSPDGVSPCSAKDVSLPARRPASSILCVDRIESALGTRMAPWTDAVDRYVAAMRGGAG
jgi:dTDP-4-dehydrorhamnose reductase